MRNAALLLLITLAGCAAPGGPYPSLQARAAEAIDPRVPVIRPINDRPASASLTTRLSALVDQAQSGNATFDSAASEAERLSAAAGSPQSEGWIAAQQALSGAIAARQPTVQALGDIDELAVALIDLAGQSLRKIVGAARLRAATDHSIVRGSVEAFVEQGSHHLLHVGAVAFFSERKWR